MQVGLLLRSIVRAAQRNGFEVTVFGWQGGYPLYALTRSGGMAGPSVYLSAGMHGDEPGGPLALLSLLRGDQLSRKVRWHVCPVLNPVGLRLGTRGNGDGIDMNRDYRDPRLDEVKSHVAWLKEQPVFDLAILMHEDWEADGFYVNEFKTGSLECLDARIIDRVREVCPILDFPSIDQMPVRGGIVHPFRDGRFGKHWPESFFLRSLGCRSGFNFEAPSCFPLAARIAAFRWAIHETVGALVDAQTSGRGQD